MRSRPAPTRAVRVNAVDTPHCHRDIVAVVAGAGAAVDVVVLPKVDDPSHVTFADHLLSALEAELGIPAGHIGLEILEEPDRPPQEFIPEPEFMGELRAPHLGLGD